MGNVPNLSPVAGAVFTVLPLFFIFQDVEGFAGEIMANFFVNDSACCLRF